ncbi:uncharacterized protein LOC101857327 [Aplysia californica]|uniref:Uncharacterized protein LOC101857327 n=1 Tax=Aplysia californica TaxID=6500 RepID=A0ABM0JMA9_APLCA|nr:uncharacterized protein LOC101857327 [Aplysia californica]
MRGKKKKQQSTNSRPAQLLSSSSGSDVSDSSGTVATRRISDRITRKSSSGCFDKPFGKRQRFPLLTDSAYDGDEESATTDSTPEKSIPDDPYGLDLMEDVPVVVGGGKKNSKKNSQSQNKPKTMAKRTKKAPAALAPIVPTSTPVLDTGTHHTKRRSLNKNSPSATPEVTPILPVRSPPDSGRSFNTPHNRRSTRKRPYQVDSDTPMLPTHLSCSSQGDSGIVVSPLPKKHSAVVSSKDLNYTKVTKSKKKQTASHAGKRKNNENLTASIEINPKPKRKRNVLSLKSTSETENIIGNKDSPENVRQDSSCFGFTSMDSPVQSTPSTPPSSRKYSKFAKHSKPRTVFPSDKDYRVAKEISLSDSPGDSVLKGDGLDSSGSQLSNPWNSAGRGSPPLFSDEMFSTEADSLEVNKSTYKPYKPVKVKKIVKRNVLKTSKMDEWASNFNMEIAELEKFELNIE